MQAAGSPARKFIAGGTNLLDLMKLEIEQPTHLVDISRLPLREIDETPDGGLRIGAQVSNTDLAADPRVRQRYPVLSQALLAGASGQLRNKATTGGNLLQRTRCPYFYDIAMPCNKREPGCGCSALGGLQPHARDPRRERGLHRRASLGHGGRDGGAATPRSKLQTPAGRSRTMPIGELHRLPGENAATRDRLGAGEMITAVVLPPPPAGRQIYRKVRDRASYAFALVSVAAIVDAGGGTIRDARLALGGVAHKPWRAQDGRARAGRRAAPTTAASRPPRDRRCARPQAHGHNDFKIALAKRTLVRARWRDAAQTGG